MGKEFIEYKSENGHIPYSASTIYLCMKQYAKNYISANRENIANIDEKVRDAVLIDVINYLASAGGLDAGLYTSDLYDNKIHNEEVEPQCLLTTIRNFFATYLFEYGLVESVLRNNHMNEVTEEFDINDGATVLVDFLNYIAEVNDYDVNFTPKELYEKYENQKYKNEMKKLKLFLEKTSEYAEKLNQGKSIDDIFNDLAKKHNLGEITQRGTYYYNSLKPRSRKMPYWEKLEMEKEIYAMTYAYGRMPKDKITHSHTEIIQKKLIEMKRK